MKKWIMFCGAATMMASATVMNSCDSKARLVSEVEGTWSSAPMIVANDFSGRYTAADVVTFTPGTDKTGGNISIEAQLDMQHAAGADAPVSAPFSMSVAGIASIKGTWRAVDHDEIIVRLDHESLMIDVDPSAVALYMNPMTGEDSPAVDSIKPGMIDFAQAEFRRIATSHFNRFGHIEVKIKDNATVMEMEIGDTDILFHRN